MHPSACNALLSGASALGVRWRSDMPSMPLFGGAEAREIVTCLVQAKRSVGTAADIGRIVVVLPVIFPEADRTDFVASALEKRSEPTAGTIESNTGRGLAHDVLEYHRSLPFRVHRRPDNVLAFSGGAQRRTPQRLYGRRVHPTGDPRSWLKIWSHATMHSLQMEPVSPTKSRRGPEGSRLQKGHTEANGREAGKIPSARFRGPTILGRSGTMRPDLGRSFSSARHKATQRSQITVPKPITTFPPSSSSAPQNVHRTAPLIFVVVAVIAGGRRAAFSCSSWGSLLIGAYPSPSNDHAFSGGAQAPSAATRGSTAPLRYPAAVFDDCPCSVCPA